MIELDADGALEASGENSLLDINQLVLRQCKIERISPNCVASLVNLKALSLSNNNMRSLAGFAHLAQLEELNLNFNVITEVDELRHCGLLRKLYLSNNLLASCAPLSSLPLLHTLCLFRNQLTGLDDTIQSVRLCPKMRVLDLDGNPLALEPGYKHHVVRALVRIEMLDGDPILALDRELSREYFAQQAVNRRKSVRYATAPADVQRSPLCQSNSESHRFKWKSLSKGRVRLYDSDRLNNDPVALTYLANHVLTSEAKPETPEEEGGEGTRSFVDRLRGNEHRAPRGSGEDDDTKKNEPKGPSRPVSVEPPSPVTSSTDASNPYHTIRRLIQKVEKLQTEIAQLHKTPRAANIDLERLRIENANMNHLRDDNMTLRQAAAADNLAKENRDLPSRLSESDAKLQEMHLQEITASGRQGRLSTAALSRPKTAAEKIKEELIDENVDTEFADLFHRNKNSLDAIRQSIKEASGDLTVPDEANRTVVVRPLTGSYEARVLKSQATALELAARAGPSLSDILALRRAAPVDEGAWESMCTPRRPSHHQGAAADRVTSTRHAWVLWEDGDAPSKGSSTGEEDEDYDDDDDDDDEEDDEDEGEEEGAVEDEEEAQCA
ncbi:hypothetical protein CTAYLR_007372 [Chrysophaeum taylorii]|uniref:Uncharacterized protein n=1 Tax=Chrysophaeum taylorii TaxID=2483200 RepID=A0AAD7U5L6_9STRA|nr:hypothetical protein CTAYLR_007372 [Chrysophaeum taylorii]